jgi:DNA-binding transcriptional LysR family regulator
MEPIRHERLPEDRLRGIATFVHVMEAGSFATAAARLRMTRSAVGKTIARLEKRLGVQLFRRSTRRLAPTEAAQAYYERCRRALSEIDAAEGALEQGRIGPRGRLRVSAPRAFGRHCVAPVLNSLVQQHAELEFELSLSDRIVDLQAEGYDLAVRIGRLPDSSGLQARRLGTQRFAMFAAPAYLERHGLPRRPEDLEQHQAVSYAWPDRVHPWQLLDASGQPREARVRRRLGFNDIDTIADAVLAGQGLGRLPWWLARRWVETGALVPVMPEAYAEDLPIHVVWPRSRFLPSKTRAAIDALAAEAPRVLTLPGGP